MGKGGGRDGEFFGKVLYEVSEREREKQGFLKALTMQALSCDSGSSHRAEQRNGKDYPQECLGCPQTERSM